MMRAATLSGETIPITLRKEKNRRRRAEEKDGHSPITLCKNGHSDGLCDVPSFLPVRLVLDGAYHSQGRSKGRK